MTKIQGTAQVVKMHKRLHIDILETGARLYTPPNFVRLQSRDPLHELAKRLTELQSRDIDEIAAFEYRHGPRYKRQART